MAHSRVSARCLSGSLVGSDGFVPHPETSEDVRRHVQRVRYPWRNRIISPGRSQSTLGQRGIIVAMDQVMNYAGMVRVLFPQLFQDGGRLKLFRQTRVIGRGITFSQNRESVEGLRFEIVWILVPELVHRFFVSDHTVAWSDWSVTRLSNSAWARTVRRIIINIERGNESPLSVRYALHRHCFFNGRLARAHLVRSGGCPNGVPPRHGDSPLSHRAFGVALSHRSKNTSRLFVEK